MKTLIHTSTALLLLAMASNLSAQIYKWVDSEGQLHYTQRPAPAGKEAEAIEDKIRFAAALKSKNKKHSSYLSSDKDDEDKLASKREEIASKQKKVSDNYKKQLITYCSSQRKNLKQLKTSSPIAWEENGKTELLTSKQKKDKIKEISKSVTDNCSEVKEKADTEK